MNRRKTARRIITCSVLCTAPFFAATPAHADIPWDHNYATNAEDDHATLDASMKGNIPAPNMPNDYSPQDDGSEATGSSEQKFDILDFAFGYHCENPVSYDSGHMMFPTYWRCDDPPPTAPPSEPPSTRTLLRRAAVSIRADGAGIYKQPPHVSYTNKYIPTLVSVTNPTQTHTVTLFGREVTVTFKATNYEWDWATAPHTPSPPTTECHTRRAWTPTRTLGSSATTTPHPTAGAHASTDPTPTPHAPSPSPRAGRVRPPTPSPEKHKPSTAWSPPKKQQAPSPWATSPSQTPTPGKKNKATKPVTRPHTRRAPRNTHQRSGAAHENSCAAPGELPPVSWTLKLKSREWEAFRVCGSAVEA